MKVPTGFIILVLLLILVSCTTNGGMYLQEKCRLLHKTVLDTTEYNYGQHIEIKDRAPAPAQGEFISLSIDDRDIIADTAYSREERIEVLKEFLTFQGDTARSNKYYFFQDAL